MTGECATGWAGCPVHPGVIHGASVGGTVRWSTPPRERRAATPPRPTPTRPEGIPVATVARFLVALDRARRVRLARTMATIDAALRS